jgi:hypothetical protein
VRTPPFYGGRCLRRSGSAELRQQGRGRTVMVRPRPRGRAAGYRRVGVLLMAAVNWFFFNAVDSSQLAMLLRLVLK